MTPAERAAMLNVLRTAVSTALLPGATAEAPGGFRRRDPDSADAVSRFTHELTTLGGFVHHAAARDASVVAELIATLTIESVVKRALMWDDAWLPVRGLAAALAAKGFDIDRQEPNDLTTMERREGLAAATVGITGAEAALAETGSVVLVSGPGRGRLASLLPPVHIAIVERKRMVRSLPDLLMTRPELAAVGSNLVCITGPSRTADIEHTLSRGVHGPREVHVVFV